MRKWLLRLFFGAEPMLEHFSAMLTAKSEAKWQRKQEKELTDRLYDTTTAKLAAVEDYIKARTALENEYKLVLD